MNWHIFHKWTPWLVTHTGDVIRLKNDAVLGKVEFQRRECEICKKSQLRVVKALH